MEKEENEREGVSRNGRGGSGEWYLIFSLEGWAEELLGFGAKEKRHSPDAGLADVFLRWVGQERLI